VLRFLSRKTAETEFFAEFFEWFSVLEEIFSAKNSATDSRDYYQFMS
jgi:hypothetical protein